MSSSALAWQWSALFHPYLTQLPPQHIVPGWITADSCAQVRHFTAISATWNSSSQIRCCIPGIDTGARVSCVGCNIVWTLNIYHMQSLHFSALSGFRGFCIPYWRANAERYGYSNIIHICLSTNCIFPHHSYKRRKEGTYAEAISSVADSSNQKLLHGSFTAQGPVAHQ